MKARQLGFSVAVMLWFMPTPSGVGRCLCRLAFILDQLIYIFCEWPPRGSPPTAQLKTPVQWLLHCL